MQNRFGQWCLLPTLSLPALLRQLQQLLSLLQCHLLDPVTSRKLEIPRHSVTASDKARYAFWMECREFIKCLLKKLLAKVPIKDTLVRSLSWPNPCKIASPDERDRTGASKHLEQTLHIMCDS